MVFPKQHTSHKCSSRSVCHSLWYAHQCASHGLFPALDGHQMPKGVDLCRCTRNGGASVHLLEGPIAAHLHRHDKIFIDVTKRSASPRPSRRGVPRGGTRQGPRGIGISPRGVAATRPGQLRKLLHQGTSSRQGGDVACSCPSGSPPPEGRRV